MPRVLQVSLICVFTAACLTFAGCGQNAIQPEGDKSPDPTAGHPKHGGWWCYPHGIPEEECSMCSAKAAAKFKEQGDWCEEHDRALSQCFICNPKAAEKYAALYEAKYGKQPPKPEE